MRSHAPILATDATAARLGGTAVPGLRGRRAGAVAIATAASVAIGAALASADARPAPIAPSARVHAPWQKKLQPCALPDVKGDAFCGSFEVYENRDARAGRKIALRIAVLPALAAQPEPDPVFIVNGGPGEGAIEAAPDLVRDPLRERRDIVFVDTRGTGGSNPLACRMWGDGTRLDHIFPLDAVETCRDRLRQHADLARYTTAAAMDDLEDVRRYLGYGQVNLIGASYGTLASQVFIARHPASVRCVVLAGVARYADPSPLYHARNAQHSLELLARDCANDAACHATFPHFADEVVQVLARLAHQPAQVTVTIPDRPKPLTVTLTRSAAADTIRFSLYSSKAAHLPLTVHRAAAGDLRDLAQAAVQLRLALQKDLALGLMFSVTCAEDLSRIDPAIIPRVTAGTFYGDDRVRDQLAACAVWPHAPKPAGPATLPPSTGRFGGGNSRRESEALPGAPRGKRAQEDSFAARLAAQPKLFVIGSDDDLA